MLAKGNSKLGKTIWCFSIPAGASCPGKSEICSSRCYAQKGFFVMPSVQRAQENNWEITRRGDFVEQMLDELKKKKATVVRIHVAGDYYSAEYVRKWIQIVRACPDIKFFTYTRSWRIPEIRKVLTELSHCPNVRMWWSVDKETGDPPNRPKTVRCAYMAVDLNDIPDTKMDLVFRDYPMRGIEQKHINGVLVCPPENGVTKLTCEKCGLCWRRNGPVPKGPSDSTRVALPLVAA